LARLREHNTPDQFCTAQLATAEVSTSAPNGGSRAATVASGCDVVSLAFQNVCFVPNLAQAGDHRAKASERCCGW
jgi:hypothetical protein